MSDKQHVANFDRVARMYRWAEYAALGPLLERTREHFLAECTSRSKAYVIGDGDGRFLARLLPANGAVEVVAVDTSARMLGMLRRRCARWSSRLTTVRGSALEAAIPEGTDFVVTHFFLDCLGQAEANLLIENIAASTRPGALWLVSDFAMPHAKTLRPLAALYVRSLYLAFRVLTGLQVTRLPETAPAMAAAGFQQIARREWLGGFLYTELWCRR